MLHIKLEHIRWRAIAYPHALEDIEGYLTASQGHQFDPRV